jgi:hypothetical protein
MVRGTNRRFSDFRVLFGILPNNGPPGEGGQGDR